MEIISHTVFIVFQTKTRWSSRQRLQYYLHDHPNKRHVFDLKMSFIVMVFWFEHVIVCGGVIPGLLNQLDENYRQ